MDCNLLCGTEEEDVQYLDMFTVGPIMHETRECVDVTRPTSISAASFLLPAVLIELTSPPVRETVLPLCKQSTAAEEADLEQSAECHVPPSIEHSGSVAEVVRPLGRLLICHGSFPPAIKPH